MSKVPQSQGQLEQQLAEQLRFLERSANAFDDGDLAEAKRMSGSIRILVHQTENSHALLTQLGLLDQLSFFSSALDYDEHTINTHQGLVMFVQSFGPAGSTFRFVPHLDSGPREYRRLPFNEWWNETIIVDNQRTKITRRDLVLTMANQDGGAHVDPGLKDFYHRLTQETSIGWLAVYDDGTTTSAGRTELVSVRQIAHEVLKTMNPGYTKTLPG